MDYGTVHKEYESVAVGPGRYAPPRVKGVVKKIQKGRPDEARICTSIVERNNLTIRILFGGLIGLAVDAGTGKMWKHPPVANVVLYEKDKQPRDPQIIESSSPKEDGAEKK